MHWVDDLTSSQLRQFAIEIADAVQGAMSTGDYSKVVTVLEGWEATVEVMSSLKIVAALNQPLDQREYRPLSDYADLEHRDT